MRRLYSIALRYHATIEDMVLGRVDLCGINNIITRVLQNVNGSLEALVRVETK